MRVLLLAEMCDPELVSVPLIGWSHAQALSRIVQTHLVTHIRHRQPIERAGLVEGRDFTTIDNELIAKPVYRVANFLGGKRKGYSLTTGLMTFAYPYFEHLVWKKFGRRIRGGEFDIVHRLTPVTAVQPSPMARWCAEAGVPFIVGPLNGGLRWPKGFESARARERDRISFARELFRLFPGYQSTRRHAAAILVGSRNTLALEPRAYRKKFIYIPENAILPQRFAARRTRTATLPVRAIFVGRLTACKGCDMLLDAAAPLIRAGKLQIEIIGDGAEMPALRAAVKQLGIESGVSLPGWVEHTKVQERLIEADLFAFPSIRDFGGGAVLEAMAVGLAPLVVDYGGPAELATAETGFIIPLGTPEQVTQRLREQLERIVADPRQLDVKGAAACERAHSQFTWDYKAARMVDIYRWLLNPNLPKPSFEENVN